MRQDWDYVLMQDYDADMAEITEQAAGAIKAIKHERDLLYNMLVGVLSKVGMVGIDKELISNEKCSEVLCRSDRHELNDCVLWAEQKK